MPNYFTIRSILFQGFFTQNIFNIIICRHKNVKNKKMAENNFGSVRKGETDSEGGVCPYSKCSKCGVESFVWVKGTSIIGLHEGEGWYCSNMHKQ